MFYWKIPTWNCSRVVRAIIVKGGGLQMKLWKQSKKQNVLCVFTFFGIQHDALLGASCLPFVRKVSNNA